MLNEKIVLALQYALPQHALSRFAGWLASSTKPGLKNYLINWFLKRYQVDMTEAIESDPFAYPSYNAFFTRHLKPECRPIAAGEDTIVAPVDGVISEFGHIEQGKCFQAKGRAYSLYSLLGSHVKHSELFDQGQFATFYLAPHHYHRVHMPIKATMKEMIYVPGKLFSVQPATVNHIDNLFARNERVVCLFETDHGPLAMVFIGAMIVGSISIAWHGQVTPTKPFELHRWCYPNVKTPVQTLQKGDELGLFELGSTVVCLFGNNSMEWAEQFNVGNECRFGQAIGEF